MREMPPSRRHRARQGGTGVLPVVTSRDGSVTSLRRPAEAGLVKAALKRTHFRDFVATLEFGVRNFSSALTPGFSTEGSGSSPSAPRTQ